MSSSEMKPKLADLRKSYEKGTLDLHNVKDNPLQLFQTWFYEAKEADAIDEANAMSLTTLGDDGFLVPGWYCSKIFLRKVLCFLPTIKAKRENLC
jgi:pyridoxine/pyridoxamine 5'-phosphate oxidase